MNIPLVKLAKSFKYSWVIYPLKRVIILLTYSPCVGRIQHIFDGRCVNEGLSGPHFKVLWTYKAMNTQLVLCSHFLFLYD